MFRCKTIETAILHENNNSFTGPLIIGTFQKRTPGQSSFAASDLSPVHGVAPAFYPIRSQYSLNLQQSLFVARKVWTWVVKRATSLFNSSVLQQCCKTSFTFLLPVLPRLKPCNLLQHVSRKKSTWKSLYFSRKVKLFFLKEENFVTRNRGRETPVRTGA